MSSSTSQILTPMLCRIYNEKIPTSSAQPKGRFQQITSEHICNSSIYNMEDAVKHVVDTLKSTGIFGVNISPLFGHYQFIHDNYRVSIIQDINVNGIYSTFLTNIHELALRHFHYTISLIHPQKEKSFKINTSNEDQRAVLTLFLMELGFTDMVFEIKK